MGQMFKLWLKFRLKTTMTTLNLLFNKLKKNKLYGPFLWMGFNCLKARVTLREQFTFYH